MGPTGPQGLPGKAGSAGAGTPFGIANVRDPRFGAVGDGLRDDTTSIQAALDAEDAQTVVVPAGTYLVRLVGAPDGDAHATGALHIRRSRKTLVLSAGATIRLADDQLLPEVREGAIVLIHRPDEEINHIRILGPGTIDGNWENNRARSEISAAVSIRGLATDIDIEGVEFRHVAGNAVLMYGAGAAGIRRVRISHNDIHDSVEGVLWKYADQVLVADNHIHDIPIQDGIEPHLLSRDWIIRGNLIVGVASGGAVDAYWGAHGGVIAHNTIRDCHQGIQVTSGATAPGIHELLVVGNVIQNSTAEGLWVRGNDAHEDTRIHISQNSIRSSGAEGIWVGPNLKGIQVSNNDISDATAAGIRVDSGAEAQISHNRIDSTGLAGITHNGQSSLIVGNHITSAGLASDGSSAGIELLGGPLLHCAHNILTEDMETSMTRVGILVQAAESVVNDNQGRGQPEGLIGDARGTGTRIGTQGDFVNRADGTIYFDGDGVQKDFVIAHGLSAAPIAVALTPATAEAAKPHYWTATADELQVHFLEAPAVGSGNVGLSFLATRD